MKNLLLYLPIQLKNGIGVGSKRSKDPRRGSLMWDSLLEKILSSYRFDFAKQNTPEEYTDVFSNFVFFIGVIMVLWFFLNWQIYIIWQTLYKYFSFYYACHIVHHWWAWFVSPYYSGQRRKESKNESPLQRTIRQAHLSRLSNLMLPARQTAKVLPAFRAKVRRSVSLQNKWEPSQIEL